MDGERQEWTVSGMDCAACTLKVTKAVERLPGVKDVRVALMTERLSATVTPDAMPAVERAVRQLGYGISTGKSSARTTGPGCCGGHDHAPHTHGHDHDHPHDHSPAPATPTDTPWYRTTKGQLVLVTGGVLALAWGVELLTSATVGYWAFVLACVIGVAPVARRAFAALRMGQPFTIEGLMTIAAIGALIIGAAEEAALVVFLFAVGEMLEGVAAGRARQGIRALAALVPKTALVEENGTTRTVSADSLAIGQTILVRPGDRIAADGTILDGISGVDESPVTGESVPRTKGVGDTVHAGSINTEAALRIRVDKTAADNTISRIVRLVEEAEEARAPTERFIDRFSRIYMPAIVVVAALVILIPPLAFDGSWDTWIYRGLALLLIGCPCALVISVPASIASALSSGARRGLLMKGGAVIEATARTRHVAFDKTGTLTRGTPVVTDLLPAAGVTEAELLETAAGVEAGSSHPLARAILSRAGTNVPPSQDAKVLPGRGAEALVAGSMAWVTSPTHAAANAGLSDPETATTLEGDGKTVVAVFREGRPLGLIAMRDEAREDAASALKQLAKLGITATMLTGDNPRTAAAIAAPLGINVRASLLPEDKLTEIRALSATGSVMMIGDGINDAPALKQAGVGVAMGSGTDVALETADAAILRDRVTDVPAMIRLAQAGMGNIRQNVAVALGLKAVFLVTSVLGITGLWIAILADTGATVLVTLNALRLLRFDPTRES